MKPRIIGERPEVHYFLPSSPEGTPLARGMITMTPDELEVIRLVDYEGLLQEAAAERMGISRGTVWRCLKSARKKVATMLVEGRGLRIIFSDVVEGS